MVKDDHITKVNQRGQCTKKRKRGPAAYIRPLPSSHHEKYHPYFFGADSKTVQFRGFI